MLVVLVSCNRVSREEPRNLSGQISYPELAYNPDSGEIQALLDGGWKEHTFSNGEKIHYQVLQGDVFVDGDIRLGTEVQFNKEIEEHEERIKSGQVAGGSNELTPQGSGFRECSRWFFGCYDYNDYARAWKDRTVRYTIASGFSALQLSSISEAISHISSKTLIRFQNVASGPNRVIIRPVASGCSADIGAPKYTDFPNYMNLSTACGSGSIIHEFGHTLGLWHEQSRCDRDNYVTVYLANVTPSSNRFNFDKHCSDGTDIGSYDYDSIMHYSAGAFAASGTYTIIPKGGVDINRIGQRDGLSRGDVSAIGKRHGYIR